MNRKKFIAEYTHFIQLAIAFSEKSRREGLLGLESELEDLNSEFFKEGMRLMVDGTSAELIDEIMTNRIANEKDKYTAVLMRIQKRTVLALQNGLNTRLLILLLNSLAGMTRKEEDNILMLEVDAERERLAQYNADNEEIEDDESLIVDAGIGETDVFLFSDMVLLDDHGIQAVLREVDSNDLAKALNKARNKIKRLIFRNMSRRASAMLKEDIKYMGELQAEYVSEAQEKILDIVRRLQDWGEITIAPKAGGVKKTYATGDEAFNAGAYDKAIELYAKEAEAGNSNSLVMYGMYLANELNGVENPNPDTAKAVELYEKAAAKGDAYGLYLMGGLYFDGKGVAQDKAKGVELWAKAAEQGLFFAQSDMGYAYENGEGIAQDYAKAFVWYTQAADQEHSGAMRHLGELYRDGKGVPKNLTKAKEWFEKAVAAGDEKAKAALEAMEE